MGAGDIVKNMSIINNW